ncbi:MAG: thiamine-monophosphate kinase [Candidatus Omnitrophica bacterium]|nr:thiamine-monophosphate kinase [Candidatus Omnitrophota bacterium]
MATELDLIRQLKKSTPAGPDIIEGIGDDTAVLKWDSQHYLLWTADFMVEGKHFRLPKDGARQVGRKALACSLSDIAAMGGIPTAALLSVGVPKRKASFLFPEILGGAKALARRFGVSIVGGDLVSSEKVAIDCTVLGKVEHSKLVLRSGACAGNGLWVTGKLGGSLSSGRHLKFIPRIKEARILGEWTRPLAMMDLSDGLALDLVRLAEASSVGAVVWPQQIPFSRSSVTLKKALCDGEDFELLVCLPSGLGEDFKMRFRKETGTGITQIGKILPRAGGLYLEDESGQRRPWPKGGYDAFAD